MKEKISFRPPFIPLDTPARWATGLLIATLAVAWIAVGVDLAELRLLLHPALAFSARRLSRHPIHPRPFYRS